jgi:capsular polysaccharide biosynthesis protein
MENELQYEKEFDLITLWRVFKRFWIVVLAVTVAFGAVGALYTVLFKHDSFVGTAYFWVNGSGDNPSSSSTMGAAQIATNYAELANKELLLRQAVKNNDLGATWGVTEDQAVSMLKRMVSSGKSFDESFIFYVSVTATDKRVAFEAISAIQHTMVEVVARVNGDNTGAAATDYITLVGEVYSEQDIRVSSPSVIKNIAIFALGGFVVAYIIVFFIDSYKGRSEKVCENEESNSEREE